MTIKIAIMECHPNGATLIKKLINKTKIKTDIDTFHVYKNEFPDKLYDGYIYTGGDVRLTEKNQYPYLVKLEKITKDLADKNKHILGICLGCQIIANTFGGKVEAAEKIESGFRKIKILKKNPLLKKIEKEFHAFNYHYDYISELPECFENFSSSNCCNIHLIKHKEKPIYGIQFHPEFDDINAKRKLKELEGELKEEELKESIESINVYSEKCSIQIMKNYLELILKSN